jgi:uncharacterized membrane protein
MEGSGGMNFSDSSTLRKRGLSALNNNWQTALTVTFVAGLLGMLQSTFQVRLNADWLFARPIGEYFSHAASSLVPNNPLLALIAILQFLFAPALNIGLNTYFIMMHKSENPPLSLLFSRLHIWVRCLCLMLLMGVFIFLWSLLLVVPGIVAAYSYSMAPYLMAENPDIGAFEAIRRSKEMMAGNKGRLFCLHLSFIGWALLSAVVVGILNSILGFVGTALGLVVSIALWVYVNSSVTAFYLELSSQKGM